MVGASFTQDELNEMSVKDLQTILDYLKLPYDKKSKRASLVVILNDYFTSTQPMGSGSSQEYPVEVPIYSARLLRIIEQNGGRLP